MLYPLNIIYFVAQIQNPGFEKLDFLVTSITPISAIPKIMIFIDNINMAGKLATYLQSQLSTRLRNRTTMLIQIFSANLTVEIRTQFLENFHNSNTCI